LFGFAFGGGTGLFGGALARFLLFALAALCLQLFFLAADQFGLAARFLLAAGEFGIVGTRGLRRLRSVRDFGRLHHGGVGAFIALDERALLAHFHLDGARLAAGVRLLDLAGGLLHQRDLLAFGRGGAMARLEVAQELLLVGVGQGVGR